MNGAFKILEDNILLKLDFSKDSYNNPKLKTVVFAGRSNIIVDHAILLEKFEALATKIDYEFMNIRGELKEMRNDHTNEESNHASQIYMSDDMPMCGLMEAYYVQQEGYHVQEEGYYGG
ncbi:hypothetical protein Tco_0064881 [Tanacetum coccineum]